MEKIVSMLEQLRTETRGIFTLATMKYLIHGGRISHIRGLLASMLNIKPVIAVETVHGTYAEMGKEITLKRAIQKIVDVVQGWYPAGTKLRVQPLHGNNLEGEKFCAKNFYRLSACTGSRSRRLPRCSGRTRGPPWWVWRSRRNLCLMNCFEM
jgi:fatty acid-binding protein DegV